MTTMLDADRRVLAAYLTRHGPTHGFRLRNALVWTVSRFWDAVYGPNSRCFMITTNGWSLTEVGSDEPSVIRGEPPAPQ